MTKRRRFSADFKARVVLDALRTITSPNALDRQ